MMSLECIILLHGLARTAAAMQPMADSLTQQGYYVVNMDYPSREASIETLAMNTIPKALRQCQTYPKVHFITHSMGGILLRYYLSLQPIEQLGRVVMISPPNHGSEVVDKLKNLWLFKKINGVAGQQLGTDANSLPAQLGAADFDLGIITGNFSINPLLSLLIAGDDDGKVSIESAKLDGMRDFLVLPYSHTFIMQNDVTIKYSVNYLQTGKFR